MRCWRSACDTILMAPEAEFGPGLLDPNDDKPVDDYCKIVTRRKKFPEDVAVKLADPARELLKVETDKGGVQYVTREHLNNITKSEKVIGQPVTLFRAGEPARFSGTDAYRKGFVHLVSDRTDLRRALDLSEDVPAPRSRWRAPTVRSAWTLGGRSRRTWPGGSSA